MSNKNDKNNKKFLHTPVHGWSYVDLNGYVSGASYLDDVPVMVLETLRNYIKQFVDDKRAVSEVIPALNLSFDAEGYKFGLVTIDDELYIFHTDTYNGIPKLIEPERREKYEPTVVTVIRYLEQAVKDIREDLDEWSGFSSYIDPEKSDETLVHKQTIERQITMAEQLLEKAKNHPKYNMYFQM